MPRNQHSLEDLLRAFANAREDPVQHLAALVGAIRPDDPCDGASPTRAFQALCHIFDNQPGLRGDFRGALVSFLAGRKAVSLYADAGLFPNRGFFAESLRRISRSLLPDDADTAYLKDVVGVLFDRASDARWISSVSDEVWSDLLFALRLDEVQWGEHATGLMDEMLEALRVISYRIASIGLEPELVRLEPSLEESPSPFLAQNPEILHYMTAFRRWREGGEPAQPDAAVVRALFDQGRALADRVRARASSEGTSLSLTLLLCRIAQHLARCEALLAVLDAYAHRRSINDAVPALVRLMKGLVADEARKDDLREFWRGNLNILARRVTDNAGRTGEHYITSDRAEFFAMFRSASVAGVVIALMALCKLFITGLHLPPLTEALAVCLNYGLGFVLIHMLHGTVATKQPAMTAATIAAGIEAGADGARTRDHLAALIARMTRSQLVAILGNVIVAVPTAISLGYAFTAIYGLPYPSPEKAKHLLADLHPWFSGSLFYAALAGICLFVTGLISGYYDNLAAYNRIPQRLTALKAPRRFFGEARWARVAGYIQDNLGALAGNFFFGFLLGGVTAFGVLFGLPVDIRHIAFSSAYVGFGLKSLEFALPWQEIATAVLGVALIGLVNLMVSFALSLRVACRARGVTIPNAALLRSVISLFLRRPREFFLPPRAQSIDAAATDNDEIAGGPPAAR